MDVTKWSDNLTVERLRERAEKRLRKHWKVIYTSFKDKDFATTCLRICTYAILFWVSILLWLTKKSGEFLEISRYFYL